MSCPFLFFGQFHPFSFRPLSGVSRNHFRRFFLPPGFCLIRFTCFLFRNFHGFHIFLLSLFRLHSRNSFRLRLFLGFFPQKQPSHTGKCCLCQCNFPIQISLDFADLLQASAVVFLFFHGQMRQDQFFHLTGTDRTSPAVSFFSGSVEYFVHTRLVQICI